MKAELAPTEPPGHDGRVQSITAAHFENRDGFPILTVEWGGHRGVVLPAHKTVLKNGIVVIPDQGLPTLTAFNEPGNDASDGNPVEDALLAPQAAMLAALAMAGELPEGPVAKLPTIADALAFLAELRPV